MSSAPAHRILHLILLGSFVEGCLVCLFFLCYDPSAISILDPVNSPEQTEQGKRVVPKKSNDVVPNSNDDVITVLMWLWPFGVKHELNNCSCLFNIKGCFFTGDRNFYNQADGVIFHHRDLDEDQFNLPKLNRPAFQKWIWMNMESPTNTPRIPTIENLFNLTVSYRQDSTIPVPYGFIEAADGKEEFVLPRKNKLVCWIVSNWKEELVRVKYFNELQKHIKVDTYGSAFGKYVPGVEYWSIITSCKFYLSFENSIHRDYITEKFYNPLSVGTVPVVLGPPRHNYENVIQGDAFIHVDDFSSPKELADHLLLLDKNEEMYLRFFEWKRYFKARRTMFVTEQICLTCDYLRRHKEYETLSNFKEWFWEN
ncbi:4-galactosyl-N-acetylglucosaminide 3-alpha-L-fucosyltransferase 9-like [Antennarius striatus]|uniref:4-galactosyl-N-acetylglucosaminide 3-alpha-L-fucosyltransferase 9-like n=1 Tax=Antennarius striatus TaxID=241820 RepID=UPI0035B161AF